MSLPSPSGNRFDLESGEAVWTAELSLNEPRYTSLIAGDGKVFYAFGGLLAFSATADSFEPLFDGKLDNTGLLAVEDNLNVCNV